MLKRYYSEQLCEYYNVESVDVVMISHHLAHAETVYNTSNFKNSIILVADGAVI